MPKYSGCQSLKLLHPGPTPSLDAGSAGANVMSPAPGLTALASPATEAQQQGSARC